MPFTTSGGRLAIDYLFSTSALTRPTGWYISLHTADPGVTGANELTSAAAPGYARQVATLAAGAVAGSAAAVVTTSGLAFGPAGSGGWPTVTHAAVWDAATGGRPLMTGVMQKTDLSGPNPVTLGVGDSTTFAAGALTFSVT